MPVYLGASDSHLAAGAAVLVTTHFMDEAEYCDKIMLIYGGKAIANGTPDELKMMIGADASMEETFISLIKSYDAKSKKQ